MSQKILYLSCHEILEYDEVSLFDSLGYEVFSPGAYVCPENRGDLGMRPGITGLTYNQEVIERYHAVGARHPGQDAKGFLTKEFVDYFDIIVVMHIPDWIKNNWEAMKGKRVIWRTIGQSVASTEAGLAPYRAQGLEIVRYSPRERNIPGFIGEDKVIRFYKDPDEYGPWSGDTKRVISFAQSMEARGTHCNYRVFEQATKPFPRALFGPGNNQPGFGMGQVPYPQLKQELIDNRVYFYTGTHPASYTLNFIESWMTGIPLVCIGPKFGNADVWRNHDLYEIPDLVEDGVTGFITDDLSEMRMYTGELLKNDKLAKKLSKAARKEAIKHFGKEKIAREWKEYLG